MEWGCITPSLEIVGTQMVGKRRAQYKGLMPNFSHAMLVYVYVL